MKFFAIDFETFYSSEYTLKTMTTDEYVSDARFEALCLTLYNDDTRIILPQEEIASFLSRLNPAKTGFIAQHAQFDGAILDEHYGFRPAFWVDTLSMSRAISGVAVLHKLDALCDRYGLPRKTVEYDVFKGKRWSQLTARERMNLGSQCLGDSSRTWVIAQKMLPMLPDEELHVIDMTIRMFTEPCLRGDIQRLNALVTSEAMRKQEMIDKLQVTPADIMSDDKFEVLLESLGVEVVLKDAKNKRGCKGAFAKSDPFMQDLIESSDPFIAELAQLRLDLKSTIQQTRAERFLSKAKHGAMRTYYNYYGAKTSHWSGSGGDNFQNLPSRGKNGQELRKSVKSEKRFKLVVADMSQVQCRMLCTIAGQHDKLKAFREKRDLYCELATKFYRRTITKADEFERQMGKTGVLQLGFQSGWGKVQGTAKRQFQVDLSEEECKAFVRTYRDDNLHIAGWRDGRRLVGGIWQNAEFWLHCLANRENVDIFAPVEEGQPYVNGPLFRIQNQKIIMPTGLKLHYDGLHWGEFKRRENGKDVIKTGWKLPRLNGFEVLYGGKMTQNLVAAFSRLAFSQAELRIRERVRPLGGKICLHTHDDLAVHTPEENAHEVEAIMREELTRTVWWLRNLPLSVDTRISEDYSK
jgi:DNA polymerase I-like protein with 3'-5' exonuclease and polymerase domains